MKSADGNLCCMMQACSMLLMQLSRCAGTGARLSTKSKKRALTRSRASSGCAGGGRQQMQRHASSERAELMLALRACHAQVLGKQEWQVAPKGKCKELWLHCLAARRRVAEGEAAEVVALSRACRGACQRKGMAGGGGSEAAPKRSLEEAGPRLPRELTACKGHESSASGI